VPLAPDYQSGQITAADSAQAASELQAFQTLETKSSQSRRAKRIRTVVIVVVSVAVVLGLCALAANFLLPKPDAVALETATVEHGTFNDIIETSGKLAALEQVTVSPEVDGTVAEVLVDEGDTVTAGQVLFTIDNPDLDRQVESAERNLESAKLARSNAYTAYYSAKDTRDDAHKAWENAQASGNDTNVRAATTRDQARAAYNAAVANPAAAPSPTAAPSAATNPLTGVPYTALDVSQLYQAWSQADAAVAQAGASGAQSVDGAWSQYEAADTAVCTAWTQVEAADLQVEEASAAVDAATDLAAKRQVTSSIAGQVVLSNIERGTKLSTLATSGKVPMQVSNTTQLLVEVEINEIDVLEVEVGQKASVTFDALPDVTAEAVVNRIATTASSSALAAAGSGVVTYTVELLIEKPDPQLKLGMSASADITTLTLKDVLMVNALAIQDVDGQDTLYVLGADGEQTAVPVKVVASSDTTAAVEGDIEAGAEVLLSAPDIIDGGLMAGGASASAEPE